MKNFLVEKEIKLSKFLLEKYDGEISYSTVKRLIRNKDVKVDGKRVGSDVKLLVGNSVDVYYDGNDSFKNYEVMLNEKGVLVVYKPAGVTVEKFEEIIREKFEGATLCHRLDRNTSGLLVLACEKRAEVELLKAFKNRTIKKEYLCEVYGKMKNRSDTLTAYLKKDEKLSKVFIADKKQDGYLKIITEYKVIKELENSSILSVNLITGKTHQIRAHLAHVGNQIIGDGKYGKNEINDKFKAKTQRLTAYKLTFSFDKESPLYSLNNKVVELNKEFKN